MCGEGAMKVVATGHNRGRKVVQVNFIVFGRERVNIKPVRVKKIGQFLGTDNIDRLRESKFGPDL